VARAKSGPRTEICGPRKGPDFKQALRFLKGIANLPWMASELSNPQLDTCSCGLWPNQIMCICPGSAAYLHAPQLKYSNKIVAQQHRQI